MDELKTSAAATGPIPFSRPDAKDDFASTREDKSVTIDLLDNDRGALGILKINGQRVEKPGDFVKLASGARVTLGEDGKVIYDPSGSKKFDALDWGDIGSDTFRYTAFDAEFGTDTAKVRVKVHGVNDAPVAHDDVVYVPVPYPGPGPKPLPAVRVDDKTADDGPIVTTLALGEEGDPDPLPKRLKIAPLANDTDAEGDPLTIAKINGRTADPGDSFKLASGAIVTVNADDKTLTYKFGVLNVPVDHPPGAERIGFPFFADSFTYRATDGDLLSNRATVTVAQTQVIYDELL